MAITNGNVNAPTFYLDTEADVAKLTTEEKYIKAPPTSKAVTISPFAIRIKNSDGEWVKI